MIDTLVDFMPIIVIVTIPIIMIVIAKISSRKIAMEIEAKRKYEEKIEELRLQKSKQSGIDDIDKMTGIQFEHYLRDMFSNNGYDVRVTQASGDYGADLILINDEKMIVVQAKRYSRTVGLRSVQEIKAAESHYNADESWVVTNSYFSKSAIKLAESNKVKLIDRSELIELCLEFNDL
jgi:restriction system protein